MHPDPWNSTNNLILKRFNKYWKLDDNQKLIFARTISSEPYFLIK